MSSADAVSSARAEVAGAGHVEPVAEPSREQRGAGVGDDDASAYLGTRQRGQGYAAQGHVVVHVGRAPAEPVGETRGLVRVVAHDRRDGTGSHRQARPGVGQRGAGRRRVGRHRGVGDVGGERQHPAHAGGGDPGADELVGVLGGGAQRDHQERGVAVERDQLARGDAAGHGVPCADPDHDHHEDAGEEHLQRVEHRLQLGHLDAGPPGGLRLAAVAVVEDLLAADPAQHSQPTHDVVGGVGEVARQLALAGAAALQRREQRPDEQHQRPVRRSARRDPASPRCGAGSPRPAGTTRWRRRTARRRP